MIKIVKNNDGSAMMRDIDNTKNGVIKNNNFKQLLKKNIIFYSYYLKFSKVKKLY